MLGKGIQTFIVLVLISSYGYADAVADSSKATPTTVASGQSTKEEVKPDAVKTGSDMSTVSDKESTKAPVPEKTKATTGGKTTKRTQEQTLTKFMEHLQSLATKSGVPHVEKAEKNDTLLSSASKKSESESENSGASFFALDKLILATVVLMGGMM